MLPCSPWALHSTSTVPEGEEQAECGQCAPNPLQTKRPPSCPTSGGRQRRGLGDSQAVPTLNSPPRPVSPGGQGPGPASLVWGYLSSCSQHLGGGTSGWGWSLKLGSVGKDWWETRDRDAGASQSRERTTEKGRMEEWKDAWINGWTGANRSTSLHPQCVPTRLYPSTSIPTMSSAGLRNRHLAAVSHHSPRPAPITPAQLPGPGGAQRGPSGQDEASSLQSKPAHSPFKLLQNTAPLILRPASWLRANSDAQPGTLQNNTSQPPAPAACIPTPGMGRAHARHPLVEGSLLPCQRLPRQWESGNLGGKGGRDTILQGCRGTTRCWGSPSRASVS